MPHLTLKLEGNGALREWAEQVTSIRQAADDELVVIVLDGGMESGAPSVSLAAKLQDGSGVFLETSLALFLTAADAMRARFGDPRESSAGNPVSLTNVGTDAKH